MSTSTKKRSTASSRYKSASHSLGKDEQQVEPSSTLLQKNAAAAEAEEEQEQREQLLDGDWWQTGKFTAEMNPHGGLADTTTFTILFPAFRESYIKQHWPAIQQLLHGAPYLLHADLNAAEGNLRISTTAKTFDPFAIVAARDMLLLVVRGVSFDQARRVLGDQQQQQGQGGSGDAADDGVVVYDVIKTKSFVRNYRTFMNRRQRLLGPNGATLKALEILTKCSITIQGKTIAVVGPVLGVKEVRRVVLECMDNNVHPIYHIKSLMVKREIAKNPKLANEDWSKYMPQFKKNANTGAGAAEVSEAAAKAKAKRNMARKLMKKSMRERKSKYTPFPPAPPKSKVDIALESGEYFLSEGDKQQRKQREREERSAARKEERLLRKAETNVAPSEDNKQRQNPSSSSSSAAGDSVAQLAERAKKAAAVAVQGKRKRQDDDADYQQKQKQADSFVQQHKSKKQRTN